MMARGTKLIAAFISTCAIVCSSQTSAEEGIKIPTNLKVLAGFGSHPVSPEIASMWFASAPMPRSGIKPALMVYFRGLSGWLDRKVTYKADSNPDPAFADFQVGDVRLFLQFWPEKHLVKVFDQEVSVAENNVVVVTGVGDREKAPVVRAVAAFTGTVPDGENPGVFVLKESAAAREALK